MKNNMKQEDKKIRVLSGIRASHESIHLGVYFGAMKGMVRLQNDPKYETYYMIADLHGITTRFISRELKKNRLGIAMDYLAAGIDPKKSVLFLQSDVHEHAELAFYLSSAVSFDRLERLPSYKEKLRGEESTVALFNYPVLMAADILLYKAKRVPIGIDQLYHLEVTREIAKKMNKRYGLDFPLPERFVGTEEDIKIPDLYEIDKKRKKYKKMSKANPKGAIFLTDTPSKVREKISKVPTSSSGGKKFPLIGGDHTLYVLTKLFISDERAKQFKRDYLDRTVRYSDLKSELSVAISKELKEIQVRRKKYEKNPESVERILAEGALKAEKVANKTLYEVKSAMGLSTGQIEENPKYVDRVLKEDAERQERLPERP